MSYIYEITDMIIFINWSRKYFPFLIINNCSSKTELYFIPLLAIEKCDNRLVQGQVNIGDQVEQKKHYLNIFPA